MTVNTLEKPGRRHDDRVTEDAHNEENPFAAMTARLDRAAAALDLDPGVLRMLRSRRSRSRYRSPCRWTTERSRCSRGTGYCTTRRVDQARVAFATIRT